MAGIESRRRSPSATTRSRRRVELEIPHIDPDIRRAETLPAAMYTDPRWFERICDRVLSRTWHIVADAERVRVPGACHSTTLLEGALDEPLLFTRDASDTLRCLTNTCTHRGMLVCEGDVVQKGLRCRYHGRRFDLDGTFAGMPEFEGAMDFPRPADSLRKVPHGEWGNMLFAALDPVVPFATLAAELEARLGWLPVASARLDATRSRDYLVHANWMLYCDNYLEGFHIPYVHAGLAGALDYGRYRTEIGRWTSVQVGIARAGEDAFAPPRESADHGEPIAGYYVWLFPATMLNFYPWGISVNAVRPVAPDRTRVSYLTYVWDES